MDVRAVTQQVARLVKKPLLHSTVGEKKGRDGANFFLRAPKSTVGELGQVTLFSTLHEVLQGGDDGPLALLLTV